jgi:hypothetical protein
MASGDFLAALKAAVAAIAEPARQIEKEAAAGGSS